MSILHGVAEGNGPGRSVYLERFCESYSEPLVDFLAATKRLAKDDSRDLVHDFWLKKLLDVPAEDNLISKFLKSKRLGEPNSFRKYLARSLTLHYLSRQRSAKVRAERNFVPFEQAISCEPTKDHDQDAFDVIWVSHLFQKVVDGVREECLRDGESSDRWVIFLELKLKPCLLGTAAKSYGELAELLELADPKSIGNSWITVKRMFERHFHRVVQDYTPAVSTVESTRETNEEVKEMLRQLAGMQALQISVPEIDHGAADTSLTTAFSISDPEKEMMYRTQQDHHAAWSELLDLPLSSWLLDGCSGGSTTLGTLLDEQSPSRKLLDSIRSQAKRHGRQKGAVAESTELIPSDFFAVVYLLAVVIASVRLNLAISKSSPADIAKKVESIYRLPWLDLKSKSTFQDYVQQLAMVDRGKP